jgi:hypothetical protein
VHNKSLPKGAETYLDGLKIKQRAPDPNAKPKPGDPDAMANKLQEENN